MLSHFLTVRVPDFAPSVDSFLHMFDFNLGQCQPRSMTRKSRKRGTFCDIRCGLFFVARRSNQAARGIATVVLLDLSRFSLEYLYCRQHM